MKNILIFLGIFIFFFIVPSYNCNEYFSAEKKEDILNMTKLKLCNDKEKYVKPFTQALNCMSCYDNNINEEKLKDSPSTVCYIKNGTTDCDNKKPSCKLSYISKHLLVKKKKS